MQAVDTSQIHPHFIPRRGSTDGLCFQRHRALQGFTMIELLIVITVIGILAAVLVPNLLATRKHANDVSAAAVGRQVLNAMAAMEINNATSTGVDVACQYEGQTVRVTSGAEEARVNAPAPVTDATCSSTMTQLTVTVKYRGGAVDYSSTGRSFVSFR